jgi:hypothetical protein
MGQSAFLQQRGTTMKTFFRVMWTYNAICICVLLVLLALRPNHKAVGKDAGAMPEVAANAQAWCPIFYYGQIDGAHYYLCQPREMCMFQPSYVPASEMHTISECSVCSDPIYSTRGFRKPELAGFELRR